MIRDWIELHYKGKEGTIYTEFRDIGYFLEDEIQAKFLGEMKTSLTTYYKYHVNDLGNAYRLMLIALRYFDSH